MSLCLEVVGASIMEISFGDPDGQQQWAALIKQRGVEVFPYPRGLSGATYRSVGGGADQIADLTAVHATATANILGFVHIWGNQASLNSNYPENWDATEIANYQQDVADVVNTMNAANLTDVIFSNMSYRTNVSGGDGVNTDIIEAGFTALGETAYDLYGATFTGAQNGDYFADTIHPRTDTGIKYIHVPLLDYIQANFPELIVQRDYEDRVIVDFGNGTPRMPYITQFSVLGTQALTTQGGDSGGSLTFGTTGGAIAGPTGTAYFVDSPELGNNFFWDSEHITLSDRTMYGNGVTYTVDYSNPAWAGREVRIRVTGFRNATGRETDVTLGGQTIRIDPQDVTASRTAEFIVTLDESGNAPQITGAPVGTLSYISSMSIDLMPQSLGGAKTITLGIGMGI